MGQALNGKSQIEEMAAYRERLDTERKSREGKIDKERVAQEEKLRAIHEQEIKRMSDELEVVRKKEEAAMEAKMQAIDRQKKEAEKKVNDESGNMDKREKERILAE